MKSKFLMFILVVVLLQVSESCKKDALPDGRFAGTWISEDKADTLYFINDHTFKKPHYDGVLHIYTYQYDEDSITVQYSGPNKILLPPTTHHYTLTRSTLIIDSYKLNDAQEPVSVVLHRQGAEGLKDRRIEGQKDRRIEGQKDRRIGGLKD